MPKVIVVAPSVFGADESLAKAFRLMGWETRVLSYRVRTGRALSNRLRKLGNLRMEVGSPVAREFNRVIRQQLFPRLSEEKADLLLIVMPHHDDDDLLRGLTRYAVPVVAWAADSVGRYPAQAALFSHSLVTYFMDGGDVSDVGGHWLPLGFDGDVFHPTDDPKTWDVLFVGNVKPRMYSKRYEFFRMLNESNLHHNYQIGFIGYTPTGFYNRLRWYPGKTIRWVSTHLPMAKLGEAIARSRIVVNIHQDDGRMPVNPIFFGIPGCRVCQVAEDSEHLGRWLRPGVEYVAVNSANFVGVLADLLRDSSEIERIATAGFAASARHTYAARVRQILTDCRLSFSPDDRATPYDNRGEVC